MAAQISRFPMAETPEERAIRAETEANVIDYARAIERRRQRAAEPDIQPQPWWWGGAFLLGVVLWTAFCVGAGWLLETIVGVL